MTSDEVKLPGTAQAPDAQPFFEGLADGEIRVQVCGRCGSARFPRTVYCRKCGSPDSFWRPITAPATLISYTVVHRAPSDEFQHVVPYGIGLVEPEPGCRLLVHLDWPPEPTDIGTAVELWPEEADPGYRVRARRSRPAS